jgi:hypothetical protein
MANNPHGASSYLYLDDVQQNQVVKKRVVWDTVELHGTDFRLAISKVDPTAPAGVL